MKFAKTLARLTCFLGTSRDLLSGRTALRMMTLIVSESDLSRPVTRPPFERDSLDAGTSSAGTSDTTVWSSLHEGVKDSTDDDVEVGLLLPVTTYPPTLVGVPLMLPRLQDVTHTPRMGERGDSGDRASRGGTLTTGPVCVLLSC